MWMSRVGCSHFIGMLAAADTIEMISKVVQDHKIPVLVIDPVRTLSHAYHLPH